MSKPQASSLLNHYHCTSFLPLLGLPDDFPTPDNKFRKTYPTGQVTSSHSPLSAGDIQAYHYFTPTLRSILFDSGTSTGQLEAMKEWQLPQDITQYWQLILHPTKNQQQKIDKIRGEDPKQAEVQQALYRQVVGFHSVRLYQYFNGIYLLAFTVESEVLQVLHKKSEEGREISLFDDKAEHLLANYEGDPLIQDYQQLQLESWLRFSRLARQL